MLFSHVTVKMEASGKHDFVATADDELSFSKGAKLKVSYYIYIYIYMSMSIYIYIYMSIYIYMCVGECWCTRNMLCHCFS